MDDKEVGDHSADEIKAIDRLLRDRGKPVSCLSRHIFAGMTIDNEPGDELHKKHLDSLMRVIEMAHSVGSPLVRIMTNKKEQILWGKNGAEKWNVAHGAWQETLSLIRPACEIARDAGINWSLRLVTERWLIQLTARKLIDDLDAKISLNFMGSCKQLLVP